MTRLLRNSSLMIGPLLKAFDFRAETGCFYIFVMGDGRHVPMMPDDTISPTMQERVCCTTSSSLSVHSILHHLSLADRILVVKSTSK